MFLHPNLQSLTISCARIDGSELDHFNSFAQRTPLSSLCLDQCDVSASGLTAVLSLPTSLKALKVLEALAQGPLNHALEYSPVLLKALSLQMTSLESLSLSLRSPRMPLFSHEFDMSPFHVLRFLRISCARIGQSVPPTSLDLAAYAPPALDALIFSDININEARAPARLHADLEACLRRLTPAELCHLARTVCLSLRPGSNIPPERREAVESLGNLFRLAPSRTPSASSSRAASDKDKHKQRPRLCVNSFTSPRGACSPYLYREYEPEELLLYDSSSEGSGWLAGRNDRYFSRFRITRTEASPDYSFGSPDDQLSPLHHFDFNSFLNDGYEPGTDHFLFNPPVRVPAVQGPLMMDGSFQVWPTQVNTGPSDLNDDELSAFTSVQIPHVLPHSHTTVAPNQALDDADSVD